MLMEREIADAYQQNSPVFESTVKIAVAATQQAVQDKYIPILQIRIIDQGPITYGFTPFDIDLSVFNHIPLENNLLIQNLKDESE